MHWLVLSSSQDAAGPRRHHQQLLNDPPILAFGAVPRLVTEAGGGVVRDDEEATPSSSSAAASSDLHRSFSLSDGGTLHQAAHLLTLMRTSGHRLLVRIAHLFDEDELDRPSDENDDENGDDGAAAADKEEEENEDLGLSEDIGALLSQFHCTGRAVEMTASANQLRKDSEKRRLRFNPGRSMHVLNSSVSSNSGRMVVSRRREEIEEKKGWVVHLNPMEVRTYEIDC